MGRVPEYVVQQILEATDFVKLVSQDTKLTRKGKNRYFGLCPFHKENTPSFSVKPEDGLYHCFGCKEGGNVFTYLKKTRGLDFPEALEILARDAGIPLKLSPEQTEQYEKREGFRQVLEAACTLYQKQLADNAAGAKKARQVLEKKSISDESALGWRLGYSPESWDFLIERLSGRFSREQLEEAGLIVERKTMKGHYDRFRNRLMFPISNQRGEIVGFAARVVDKEDEPKYLNSPEGPLFAKGSILYGLPEARDSVREKKEIIIVEGYTDAIQAHQRGVGNVVSTMGTTLTEEHLALLHKIFLEDLKIQLIFDGDEPGLNAAERTAGELLGRTNLWVNLLPQGLDPDDFLIAGKSFTDLPAMPASSFYIERLSRDLKLDAFEGKTTLMARLKPAVEAMPPQSRRAFLEFAAEKIGLSLEAVLEHSSYEPFQRGRETSHERRESSSALEKRTEEISLEVQFFNQLISAFNPQTVLYFARFVKDYKTSGKQVFSREGNIMFDYLCEQATAADNSPLFSLGSPLFGEQAYSDILSQLVEREKQEEVSLDERTLADMLLPDAASKPDLSAIENCFKRILFAKHFSRIRSSLNDMSIEDLINFIEREEEAAS